MKCPKCESENTQRLEVTFNSGTQNISTSSNSTGIGIGSGGRIGVGLGRTKTSGQSQSILAQQVAPPAKKSLKWSAIGIAIGLVSALPSLSAGTVSAFLSGVVILTIWSGISGYFFYSRFQFNSKEWPGLHQRWSESWICHKCGGIYHQA